MPNYAIGPDRIRKAIQNREEPAINPYGGTQPEEESEAFYYQKENKQEPAEVWTEPWDKNDAVIDKHPEMNMNYLDYSDSVKQQMGGDPYAFDPTIEANTLYKREEPTIFRSFFQNQYDINNLPPEAANAWGKLKEGLKAKAYQQAKMGQESQIRLYNHKMSEWKTVQEIRAKELKAAGKHDQAAKVTGGISDASAIALIENSRDIPFDKRAAAKKSYLESVQSTPQRDALINTLNTYSEKDEDTPVTSATKAEPAKQKAAPPVSGNKTLTREIAIKFLKQTKGDKEAARKLAKDDGYEW